MNRNDTRVLIGQKTRIASIVLFMVVYFNTAESGWKQLGFAGSEITALCIGKEALHATSAVFAAVYDSGVFAISLPNDSIYKYPYPFNENDQPAGKIHALLVSKDGNTVFAGTDSGLYETSLLSSSLPAWKKIPSVTAEPVYGIAFTDSTYCAASASTLYRSKYIYGPWSACSLSTSQPTADSALQFTSLVSWPAGNGFAVGLTGSTVGNVYFGSKTADSWITTCIEACTCLEGFAHSLAIDSVGKLYAGTSNGIFYGDDFDTGCWHGIVPQLPLPVNEIKTYGNGTSGLPADLYAATDSGLYLRSVRTSSSTAWKKIFDKKTYAVEITGDENKPSLYAATPDGIWKYDQITGVKRHYPDTKLRITTTMAAHYSIDGKRLRKDTGHMKTAGVFLAVEYDRSGKPLHIRRFLRTN